MTSSTENISPKKVEKYKYSLFVVFGTFPRTMRRVKLRIFKELTDAEKYVETNLSNYASMEIDKRQWFDEPAYHKEYINNTPSDIFVYDSPTRTKRKKSFRSEIIDRRDGKSYFTMRFYGKVVIGTIDSEDEDKIIECLPKTVPYWNSRYNKKGQFVCMIFYSRNIYYTIQSMIYGNFDKRPVTYLDGNHFNFCKSNMAVKGKVEDRPKLKKIQSKKLKDTTVKPKKTRLNYKGVYLSKDNKKSRPPYISLIKHEKKMYNLGRYHNPEDAARAYDRKLYELKGVTAQFNFPDELYFDTTVSKENTHFEEV